MVETGAVYGPKRVIHNVALLKTLENILKLDYTHRVGGPGVSFGFETPQTIQELLMTLLTFRKSNYFRSDYVDDQ